MMNYILQIKAFQEFVQDKSLSAGQIALWYALMYINNRCNWEEWFTVANRSLESNSGISRQGIVKARNCLKQYGLIDFRSNGTKATSYRITVLYSVQAGIQDSVQNGIQSSIQIGVPNGSTLNKHKLKQDINNPPKSPQGEECAKKNDWEETFNRFWEAYPKKAGKGNCEKWFKSHKPNLDLLEEMLAAIRRQKQSDQWQRDNGKYIPYPHTWLNGKRWEDEQTNEGGGWNVLA